MKKQIKSGYQPLLLALLLLAITGCSKQKDLPDIPVPPTNTYPTTPPKDLPPATQTGAGTLGCKINGRVWTFWVPPIALTPEQDARITESDDSGSAAIKARLWSSDTFANQYGVYHDLALFFLNPSFEEREINKAIGSTLTNDGFSMWLKIGNQLKFYLPDTSALVKGNRLIVDNLDTENNIISGRFNMTIYRELQYHPKVLDRSDSLVITDGRFDFQYTPQ
jgi:hypothetical protein